MKDLYRELKSHHGKINQNMDPIADMLVRIKNAQAARKKTVSFGHSKIKWEIAKIIEQSGYIGETARKGRRNKKIIEVALLYDTSKNPCISGIRRVSSPVRKIYRGFREIFAPRNGFGIAVYSTPKGLLTDRQARKEKIGGEVLFEIW